MSPRRHGQACVKKIIIGGMAKRLGCFYDWGIPRLDSQHYEGYPIDIDRLLYAVREDTKDGDSVVTAEW